MPRREEEISPESEWEEDEQRGQGIKRGRNWNRTELARLTCRYRRRRCSGNFVVIPWERCSVRGRQSNGAFLVEL